MAHDETHVASPPEGLVDRRDADALDRDAHGRERTGPRRPGRLIGRGIATVSAVVIIYFLATLAQVVQTGRSHGAEPADAIVVMGAAQYDGRPSPQLAARLDHVVDLWHEGAAPTIVVTGGKIPGDRFTEAEASAHYLADRGVPDSVIVEVGSGSNTLESVEAATSVLTDLDISSVVVVTDPYHSLRSRLIVEGEGFDVDVAATDTSVVTGWAEFRRNLTEAGGVAIGRIIGFDRLSELTD